MGMRILSLACKGDPHGSVQPQVGSHAMYFPLLLPADKSLVSCACACVVAEYSERNIFSCFHSEKLGFLHFHRHSFIFNERIYLCIEHSTWDSQGLCLIYAQLPSVKENHENLRSTEIDASDL
jgi:hypothetical protein